MGRKAIFTENAPAPMGAYAQAVRAGDFVFTSGQLPIDPALNKVTETSIEGQSRQVLKNLREILIKAGGALEGAVMVRVYLKDLNDLKGMNEVYGEFFGEDPPARMVFEAARLPGDARIMMDAVAYVKR